MKQNNHTKKKSLLNLGIRETTEKATKNLNLKIRKILSPTFVGENIENKHSSHHFIS